MPVVNELFRFPTFLAALRSSKVLSVPLGAPTSAAGSAPGGAAAAGPLPVPGPPAGTAAGPRAVRARVLGRRPAARTRAGGGFFRCFGANTICFLGEKFGRRSLRTCGCVSGPLRDPSGRRARTGEGARGRCWSPGWSARAAACGVHRVRPLCRTTSGRFCGWFCAPLQR